MTRTNHLLWIIAKLLVIIAKTQQLRSGFQLYDSDLDELESTLDRADWSEA